MSYTPRHDYRIKDALERGDDRKKVKGTELMEDFEAISSDLRRKEGQINDLIQNGGGSGGGGGGPVGWNEITGKPSTYPPSAHDHDGEYLKDYTEVDPVFTAHVSSGITQTDIDQWNAAASGTAPVVSVNAKTGAVVLDHADVGAAKDDHNHDGDYAPTDHNHDSDYAPIGHDHAIDDLSDVNAGSPTRDDFLIWNGSNWVATDLSIIETELRFKGGVDMTGAAPSNPENGDLYVNNTAGEIDSSWGVIAGSQVLEGKFVGYGADAGRWFLLGDMAQAGVSSVSPGLGIDVDDNVPAEPVVSIDRAEVDKWYAAKDHDHDGVYLKDYTETDPVFNAHVSSSITQTDIDKWNSPVAAGKVYESDNGITVDNVNDKVSMSGSYTGTFSATVALSSGKHTGTYFYREGQCGIAFTGAGTGSHILPSDGDGTTITDQLNLGAPDKKFRYAYFSGTVHAGSVTSEGDVVAFSDARLKDNVKTLDGSKVFEMRGVSFDKNGKASSGVIAQELQEVAPELVSDDGEYLAVAYGNLVGYLIEAVKQLKAEIEELKRG